MKQNDYAGYEYETRKDTPAMKAVKKAIKEIAVEKYIDGLYKKDATKKKG